MKKKKIPISLLEGFEPIIKENSDIIEYVDEPNSIYNFQDKDPNSGFYFVIPSSSTEKGKPYVIIKRQPKNEEDLNIQNYTVSVSEAIHSFKKWVEIIRKYNDIESVLDDPIIKAYEEEFFTEYRILDEDADTKPFNTQQQILLDKYLGNVILKLEAEYPNKDVPEINDIVLEAKSLKRDITSLSKNQTMSRLSRVWAKAKKFGLETFNLFWKEAIKELSKGVITGLLS